MKKAVVVIMMLILSTSVQAGRKEDLQVSFTAGVCALLSNLVLVSTQERDPTQALYFRTYVMEFAKGSGKSLGEWGVVCKVANESYKNFMKQTEV